jgi:hypothetical protein
MKSHFFKTSIIVLISQVLLLPLYSQTEAEPWGNISGMRIDGQLMAFETNISLVQKDWSLLQETAKEKQQPKYARKENEQTISSNIDSLYFTESITDQGKDLARIFIVLNPKANMTANGVYFCLKLPLKDYANGTIQLDHSKAVPLSATSALMEKYIETPVRSVQFVCKTRKLKLIFKNATRLTMNNPAGGDQSFFQIFIPLHVGDLENAQSYANDFIIQASGLIDRTLVHLSLDTDSSGRSFRGFGGNFRLQNPIADPQVIDYCLKNMRVAMGRVEMPWSFWQPDLHMDPIAEAKAGKLNPRVQKSMEMARRLYKLGMPVILTAWAPPAWAVIGKPKFRPGPDGVRGNPLDHSKTNEIYQSIADYIQYLKDEYGVEIADFSFNESDLGINIRQTGEEHAELIKGLGAYFVKRNLHTKMLLGDNSDATTFKFIEPAMNDPATRPFIGAVSFHSWRGWDSVTLQHWAGAATTLGLPLIIAEGSIDAAAWAYPAIFEEQTYALKEINLYIRLLAICQPEAILQWQLTSDYSPLIGGGLYGDQGPLRPTQRFWNLKQLASVTEGLKAMSIQSASPEISCAALGDNDKGIYTIEMVNNGARRPVSLKGLPEKVKSLKIIFTDKMHSMEEEKSVPVKSGEASFILNATSYTTLESQ